MAFGMHEPIDVDTINLTYFCRGCKARVRGIPLTEPQFHISPFDDDPWLICRCPTRLCKLSFVIYDRLNDRVIQVYPYSYASADDYHESIPEKIREDLAEAEKCSQAQAYKGAVVMYRRALQNVVLNLFPDNPEIKTKKLWEQIDELFNKGFITRHLKESAHEIRQFGNFGAHPQDDNLDKATRDDVETIDHLTWDIIHAIYIVPFQTNKLKEKREKEGKT
jgi:hypothetical protein